jgi:hypothetical protein
MSYWEVFGGMLFFRLFKFYTTNIENNCNSNSKLANLPMLSLRGNVKIVRVC